jgi:hypothetical protein
MGGTMRCGSGGLPVNAITGGRVRDRAAVTQALKQLTARTEITETRALVAVSDAVATFRILRMPPATADKDVTALMSKELPLDPERLATRWFEVGRPEQERVVYAAAWDRELVKEVGEAVHQAGLEPVVVELKSASVARATAVASCIVVDLTSDPVEIFLLDRHLPQLWLSVQPSASAGDDLLEALAAPLRSVLRFHRRQIGHELPSSSPVLVSGEQAMSAQSLDRLAEQTQHPVMPMPAPARVPGNVRHATYMTCLGLLMRRT